VDGGKKWKVPRPLASTANSRPACTCTVGGPLLRNGNCPNQREERKEKKKGGGGGEGRRGRVEGGREGEVGRGRGGGGEEEGNNDTKIETHICISLQGLKEGRRQCSTQRSRSLVGLNTIVLIKNR
jgi:hypothetical protein